MSHNPYDVPASKLAAVITFEAKKGKAERTAPTVKQGFAVFIDTFCQGRVPIVSECDGKAGSKGHWVVYATELEAQLEIADDMMERLRQFIDSKGEERDFEDASEFEEFILPVDVDANGVVWDEQGNSYGTGPE